MGVFDIGTLFGTIELGDGFTAPLSAFKKLTENVAGGVAIALGEKIVDGAIAAGKAVLGFTDDLTSMADSITNTSNALGVGTEELQEFAAVGAGAGVTAEEIAAGIKKLQLGMTDGNKEVAQSLKFLGLSAQELKNANPSDQLRMILTAVDKVPNQLDRARVATELLGKAGTSLAPLGKNIDEVIKRAHDLGLIMSKDTIKAAADLKNETDQLGATLGGLKNNFAAVIVESEPLHVFIVGLTDILGQLSVWVKQNEADLRNLVDGGVVFVAQALVETIKVVEIAAAAFKALADIWTITTAAAEKLFITETALRDSILHAAVGDMRGAIQVWQDYQKNSEKVVKDANKDLANHEAKLNAFVGITSKVGNAFQVLSDKVGAASGKHHELADATDKRTKSGFKSAAQMEAEEKAAHKFAMALANAGKVLSSAADKDAIGRLFLDLGPSTMEATDRMDDLVRATNEWGGGVSKLSDQQLKGLIEQLQAAAKAGGDSAAGFDMLRDAMDEGASRGDGMAKALGFVTKEEIDAKHAAEELAKRLAKINELMDKSREWGKVASIFSGLGEVFEQLGISADHGFGQVVEGLSEFSDAASQGFEAAAKFSSGDVLGGIVAGIGALGTAIKGAKNLFNGLFGHAEEMKVNDLRDEIVKTAGGFDKVAAHLESMGLSAKEFLDVKTIRDWDNEVMKMQSLDKLTELSGKLHELQRTALTEGAQGLAAMFRNAAGQTDAIERVAGLQSKINDLTKQAKELEDKGDFEGAAKSIARKLELQQQLGQAQRAAAEESDALAGRFDRLGILGFAMFQQLREQGLSTVDALNEMGPALDAAIKAASDSGVELSGQFAALAAFRAKVADNSDLVSAAEGLSSVFEALRATGGLTAETFAAFTAEAKQEFDELTEKGFTSNEALALLAPTLLQIKKAAAEGRVTIDEETQALIDQAGKAGLLEGLQDPMQEMLEIQKLMLETTAALVKAFGGDLPASVRRYIDELNNIPEIPTVPGSDRRVTSGQGDRPEPIGEGLARGGLVTRPAIHPLAEQGPEAVIPLDTLERWIQPAGDGQMQVVNIHVGDEPLERIIMKKQRDRWVRA